MKWVVRCAGAIDASVRKLATAPTSRAAAELKGASGRKERSRRLQLLYAINACEISSSLLIPYTPGGPFLPGCPAHP